MTLSVRAIALLAIALAAHLLLISQSAVTVTFVNVPSEVTRVTRFEWREGLVPREIAAPLERAATSLLVSAPPGLQSAVLFYRDDGAYAIDGPFPWPAAPSRRMAPEAWRRTIAGAIPPEVPTDAVPTWLGGDAAEPVWPRCFRKDVGAWQCLGVSPNRRGIVALASPGVLWWASVDTAAGAPLRRAGWGRVVAIDSGDRDDHEVKTTFAYPVAPPSERLATVRLGTAPVSNAESVALSSGLLWIVGPTPPPMAWLEIRTADSGPAYVSLQELSEGLPSTPMYVRLLPHRTLTGRVTAADGQPAPGTLVTVFRAIDPRPAPGNSLPPRRVFTAETVAGADGSFVIDALGEADYEVVAWHAQLGRESLFVQPAQTTIAVTLRTAGTARGRIVSSGQAVAGIDVVSVPDMTTFNAARDMTDVKGGDAKTDADGRFSVMLASAGGGELRIGGAGYAVRRVPLPRPAAASLDLGDIEIAAAIDVTIVLDREVACGVRAVGPIGRAGLQVITAVRATTGTFALSVPEAGVWQIGLLCTAEKHALSPASMQITPAQAGKELHFVVR